MQPGSSTVACFADLQSSFSTTLSTPPAPSLPNVLQNSNQCLISADGFYCKPAEQFFSQLEVPAPQQYQQRRLDVAPSTVSCSPPLTPPALELLKPGMRDVPAWLKSLRLHKYTSLFAELSYEEMMTLDEAELERRNVTKGARTKILQSIQKLYSRSADLRTMHEADILITSPFLPTRDWSQVVRNPAVITPGSMPQRMPDQFVRQWPSILPLEAARPTNVHMRSRPRPMLSQSMSLWDSLSATCPIAEKGGDTTSGYCSSTSERSSGAALGGNTSPNYSFVVACDALHHTIDLGNVALGGNTSPNYSFVVACDALHHTIDLGNVDVPAWLKSLRLHKYTSLFAELSYEEMMTLDEAELERRNVTKGARTKILQSIQKLYSRSADLRTMHEVQGVSEMFVVFATIEIDPWSL
ncbi:hypothetical protein ANCCEY_12210 [Ancylostoma ceylanicum]|uniref:SAM domain-containing protein n=1 Tax=Ancylostoma ceylanicum TaxID=53326 RepID=A0A0D6LBR0_9BILA|nr:hypothetical protein ANCCEY_12210 [Ancylostoma ceylanicum]